MVELEDIKKLGDLLTKLEVARDVTKNYLLNKYGDNADSEEKRDYYARLLMYPMSPLDSVRSLIENLYKCYNFDIELDLKLPSESLFLVRGDAGVGKTHGVLDIANSRIKQELFSLVLFGDSFDLQDPWKTMMNELGIPESIGADQFRVALNSAGEVTGYPLILFIDALNETKNFNRWLQWLPKIEYQIRELPYLKLCITCRENYINGVVPPKMEISEYKHRGFFGVETEAQLLYANHYKVKNPPGIYFHKEFSNPLFLKFVMN